MCAVSLGKDACQGDSGGPLVLRSRNGATNDVQVGVVSWGLGKLSGFCLVMDHLSVSFAYILTLS